MQRRASARPRAESVWAYLAMASENSCAERVAKEAALPRPPPSCQPQQPPPEQEYDFVEEPAREFFCAVSLELLREPQQTDCCGHHLSVEVAQRLQGEGKPCPVCQKPHFTTHPDLFHKRRMQQSIVRCTCRKNGCDWVGELGNLENHVTKCPKRLWQCVYCAFSGLGEVEEDHLSGCGQFPVPCPNGCEAGSVERCSLERHLLECPLQLVGCEYVAMGCAVRLPRREMSEHIRQSGQEHLLKMCAANLTVSRELSRKVEEKEQQIAELREEMRRTEGRVEERMKEMERRMVERVEEMEGRVVEKVKEKMGEMERSVKEEMREMKGRVKGGTGGMDGRVKKVEKAIETVQLQVTEIHSEVVITVPPVEYTICKFSALKAQDKEWQSPPFYSHHGGYKMCIGVWPNSGPHVSIQFYKMRDANTEGLKWPAKLPVTIHLLNQTTGQWEQEHTNNPSRSKPSSEMECSDSHCYYLPHSELAPYVKDDSLCIRVTSFTVS